MAKSACKCKKPAECEECPEWIFTFADLVMLMMGFFVILWVTKPGPTKPAADQADQAGQAAQAAAEDKWLDTVVEIRKAFGYEPGPEEHDPIAERARAKRTKGESTEKGPGKAGETTQSRQGTEGTDPLVMNVRPGTHVSVGGKLLFDLGEAKLTPDTTRTLDEIARLIKGHRNIIQVKGHASLDDVPDRAGVPDLLRAQQQMDLTIRRAQAAAAYLIGRGLSPDVVRVQGCSTYEPVVQKVYTPQGQSLNRRVEVEVTDTLVEDRQDHAAPATAPSVN